MYNAYMREICLDNEFFINEPFPKYDTIIDTIPLD